MRQPLRAAAVATRYLGAAALLGVGLDHLEQYSTEHYSAIPTIGTLFALNFVSAALIAGALAHPCNGCPAAPGGSRCRCSAPAGSASRPAPLAGLLLSESTGLFGFMEVGYRPAIVLSLVLEATAASLLVAHVCLVSRAHLLHSVVCRAAPRSRRPWPSSSSR